MCQSCGKNSCTGCSNGGSSNSQIEAVLAEMQDQIEALTENTKAFACGHPILLIQNVDDISQFDGDGLGSGCWDKWAVCDGKTHTNPVTKKPFVTPNFIDRFIVQARGSYAVDDVGGSDKVQLTTPEMPTHNHGVSDPGHTHTVSDPGHNHPIDDDGHVHQATASPHNHSVTLGGGSHGHTYQNFDSGDNYKFADVEIGIEVGPNGTPEAVSGGGEHSHTGSTDNSATAIEIDNAATGIEVLNALTGISVNQNITGVTVNNEGGNQPHENRPPYYAALYVIKYY